MNTQESTKPSWFVYRYNSNKREIATYDVFRGVFYEECREEYKKHCTERDQFSENVRRIAMYYFWKKYEWEIVLSNFTDSDQKDELKIDIYDQLMLNWDAFINYLWTALFLSERGNKH